MITAARTLGFVGVSVPFAYTSAEDSDKYVPAAIEKASTNISTTPVKKIVFAGTVANAMPDSNPTVDTRLSSTPKTKFLKNDTERALRVIVKALFIVAENDEGSRPN